MKETINFTSTDIFPDTSEEITEEIGQFYTNINKVLFDGDDEDPVYDDGDYEGPEDDEPDEGILC